MHNRPTNLFDAEAAPHSAAERAWRVDRFPGTRLAWLLSLIALPLVIIALRLAHLQVLLPESFVVEFDRTTADLEPIPCPDSRILAADGRVLAEDVRQFEVLVHYRWLEEPADAAWLRKQALRRLTPHERRDRDRIERAERRVLAERDAMWRRLAEQTGTSEAALTEDRDRIQHRVERIVAHVERARDRRRAEQESVSQSAPAPPSGRAWWQTAWLTVVDALTTPPEPPMQPPLVVQEEEDDHALLDGLSLQDAVEIEAHPELYPGVRIRTSTRRVYPQGPLAAHVIGTRSAIRDEELQRRRERFPQGDPLDYQPGDRIGRTGVERAYDRQLRGLRGVRRIVRDRSGEIIRSEVVREPRMGRDLVLTLHLSLQERAEALLDETLASSEIQDAGGAIVVLDVHTGAVLSAASAPRLNLTERNHLDAAGWKELVSDPRRPLFPRATQMTLPPGSVFKTATAVALLESGLDPHQPFVCQGYLDQPDRHRCYIYRHYGVGHGELDLTDALAQSCNVYFFAAARRAGPQPLVAWARRLGFGQSTGIDLPGESAGNLPHPLQRRDQWSRSTPHSAWYPGDTLGLAIGQSRLTVT
ncbi:MAG: penicillin-binding transpeptidase domain-containing protein, partial [Planctomycetaceae bacterium]